MPWPQTERGSRRPGYVIDTSFSASQVLTHLGREIARHPVQLHQGDDAGKQPKFFD